MNLSRLLLVSLLICPSLQADNLPPVDENVQALRVLEQQLGAGRLADAEHQLQGLQQRIPGDTRLQGARRLLAAAYLAQGRRHLASGDLAAAGQALQQARRHLPNADEDAALERDIGAARAAAEARAQAQALAAQQAEAQRLQALRQAEQARAAQAQALAAEQARAAAAAAAEAARREPQHIDLSKPLNQIALPMLDQQDNQALRELLDGVAADLVQFDCRLQIQVRQVRDYAWVAALLAARVKKLDSHYELQPRQVLLPEQAPQLLLDHCRQG